MPVVKPCKETVELSAARAAAESIREMRKSVTLGGLKIKDLISEGRDRALGEAGRTEEN